MIPVKSGPRAAPTTEENTAMYLEELTTQVVNFIQIVLCTVRPVGRASPSD